MSSELENEKRRIEKCRFYVAVDDNEKIIGCGAISYFWEDPKDSIILTIFVDAELQHNGIGRKIIETLENDEIYKSTHKTHVFSSIPGLPVYRHLGYEFEDNKVSMDIYCHFRLLKTHV
jgi:GNAT superfamily N-acetyltransferase